MADIVECLGLRKMLFHSYMVVLVESSPIDSIITRCKTSYILSVNNCEPTSIFEWCTVRQTWAPKTGQYALSSQTECAEGAIETNR